MLQGCTIVGSGDTKVEVEARVKQIKRLVEDAEAEYEIEKLNERMARLSGGVAVIQVAAFLGQPFGATVLPTFERKFQSSVWLDARWATSRATWRMT